MTNAWLRGDWCGRGPGSYVAELHEWQRRLTPEERRRMYRPAVGDVRFSPLAPLATDVAWKWNRDELYDDRV